MSDNEIIFYAVNFIHTVVFPIRIWGLENRLRAGQADWWRGGSLYAPALVAHKQLDCL